MNAKNKPNVFLPNTLLAQIHRDCIYTKRVFLPNNRKSVGYLNNKSIQFR